MTRRRIRSLGGSALFVALVIALAMVGLPAGAASPRLPDSMAALGDSITRGFNACGAFVDCPAVSWSTGDGGEVKSHYLRLLARNPEIEGRAFNDAASGAKVSDLERQAELAVSQEVDYVTILIGANDACTPTEDAMTPVEVFESRLRTGVQALRAGLPQAQILVASIPDLKRLWRIGKDSPAVRGTWMLTGVCQSMLANPASTAPQDEARRDRVRQRVADYNDALRRVCRDNPPCRFDNNAVFEDRFELEQLSTRDYFHPNIDGQQAIADVTYRNGFRWNED
jgi:lysophospholipase L1-like esterase